MWQAWINVCAGFWALISSSSENFITPTNFFITGLIVAIFGFWTPLMKWQGYVNGFLGLWLMLSAFIPSAIEPTNLFIIGVVITVFALWRAISTYSQISRPQVTH